MSYHVEFSKNALRQLKKLDKYTGRLIVGWIRKNLEGCEDPRIHGKALTSNRSGQWRYRIGDYRLICNIIDNKLLIMVVAAGHRRDIYDLID